MRLLISLSALFVSILLVQMSIGTLRPFDTISGQSLNFSSVEIGLIASGHFVGFLTGCAVSPKLVFRTGHSRAFAVMVGLATISIIAHPLMPDPIAWTVIRAIAGFAVAGCYTVIESWLQAKITNAIRGRVFSIYRMVDLAGQLCANAMIAVLTPASYISYNIIAIIMCLSMMPLALTQSKEPSLPAQSKLRPLLAMSISPLAAVGVAVAGMSTAAFGSVAPLYAANIGLNITDIAVFLMASIIGGLVAQWPAGALADRMNRRTVLMIFGVLATVTCLLMSTSIATSVIFGHQLIFTFAFLFGFTTFPIYSLAAAHANDFATSDQMLDLSASLIFFYAIGAIVSPIIAGYVIDIFGPPYLFTYVSLAHILLMLYTIFRGFVRPSVTIEKPYAYMPRTTMFIANLLRHRGNRNRH